MKPNQSLQTISNIPITKEGVYEFAERLRLALTQGEVNPLDLKLHFKALDLVRESIKPELDALALTEAEMYNKAIYKGFAVSVQEMGVSYDYSNCNDPVLKEIEAEFDRIKALKKGREDMLKTLRQVTPMIDPNTGEAFEAYPPVKKSTTTIVLKLQ